MYVYKTYMYVKTQVVQVPTLQLPIQESATTEPTDSWQQIVPPDLFFAVRLTAKRMQLKRQSDDINKSVERARETQRELATALKQETQETELLM